MLFRRVDPLPTRRAGRPDAWGTVRAQKPIRLKDHGHQHLLRNDRHQVDGVPIPDLFAEPRVQAKGSDRREADGNSSNRWGTARGGNSFSWLIGSYLRPWYLLEVAVHVDRRLQQRRGLGRVDGRQVVRQQRRQQRRGDRIGVGGLGEVVGSSETDSPDRHDGAGRRAGRHDLDRPNRQESILPARRWKTAPGPYHRQAAD